MREMQRATPLAFMTRYYREFFSFFGMVLVLGPMLLPGYILTLDLVWVPHMPLLWNTDAYNNTYPTMAFFHYLSFIFPGWVGEKILLMGIFFSLFYIPLRFLPWVEGTYARLFAAGLYALNPFVYARMLAGQWLVLLGYALLPLMLYLLLRFLEKASTRRAVALALTFVMLGLFSIHYVFLGAIVALAWVRDYIARTLWHHYNQGGVKIRDIPKHPELLQFIRSSIYVVLVFLALSSFWLLPSLVRRAPLEARFDTTHFEVFAAASNATVPVLLNLAVLGGYWGEGTVWGLYFLWPQLTPVFWVAAGVAGVLILVGIWYALWRRDLRRHAYLLVVVGVCAYIAALGAADTPFKVINSFLYTHLPLWNGLRDSHKIAGILAFVYVVFAGLGAGFALDRLKTRLAKRCFACVLGAVLLALGMFEWGGFHRQLQSVWYPNDWTTIQSILDQTSGGKVLILPWHGYLSLDFDNHLVVSNPTPSFFGADRVTSSRSIDVGSLHDEEVDRLDARIPPFYLWMVDHVLIAQVTRNMVYPEPKRPGACGEGERDAHIEVGIDEFAPSVGNIWTGVHIEDGPDACFDADLYIAAPNDI